MLTAAEYLLICSDALKVHGIVDMTGIEHDIGKTCARIKIGQQLSKRPAVCLRAIVEEWEPSRIVRELY